ncbi:acetamidase [Penicillium brasilianum]|uniref:amidase n=1 Tax=Penicillium brasilianum TaxID=104259 RepID=A0A1S9RG53_PENBI|nr:acetamidase [Penicillium brasilianum]
MPSVWENIVKAKRDSLEKAIPTEWILPSSILPPLEQADVSTFIAESGWFSDAEKEILSSSVTDLLPRLASRQVSAVEVTKAYCKSAAAAQQLINPLTEIFFDEALEMAKTLDEELQLTGKPKGLLHGLPISIKDNFHIQGKDATQGFTSLVGKPAEYHCSIVQALIDAGAVLYVKTNVPPGMKRAETENTLFGKTLNPFNRHSWSVGGSSGGEGALLGFGGSPLGIGSDIGGSLRIPTSCAGIFTLRPCVGRFPMSKTSVLTAGQDSIMAVPGPMARTMEDLILASRIIIQQSPWKYDPQCVPLPWKPVDPPTRLKLAVMWDDGMVTPTPPVRRALQGAVHTLRDAGHEIVDWKISPEEIQELVEVAFGIFLSDGGQWLRKVLEPTSEPIPSGLSWHDKSSPKTIFEMHELHVMRDKIRMEWFAKWDSFKEIDGILLPTSPYSIPEHGNFTHVVYTLMFNLLDWPATSFPSGYYTNAEIDGPYVNHAPLSETDKKIQRDYNPILSDKAPISFQIVGRKMQEEKTLMMTDIVYRTLKEASKA